MGASRAAPPHIPRWLEAPAALLALAVASPVLLLFGALIAVSSPGPVLFRQVRVGLGGRRFVLYKMRTMRVGGNGPEVTAGDDERVTRVGRLLRRTKLDELPELWNVLRGDLSLVGPRPEVPRYVDTSDPSWQAVLRSRPGLTHPVTLALRDEEGLLAAVPGDREDFYLRTLQPYKLEGYLRYAERRTLRSDLSVLWMTAAVVVRLGRAPAPKLEDIRTACVGRS